MAKHKEVDNDLLADALREVESGGAISSLGVLYGEIASHYNSHRHKNLPVLTPQFVGMRVKSLKFITKTQPGKRGSSGPRKTMNGDNILISLTDWKEKTVEVGKYIGNDTKQRFILKFDSRQWIFSRETGSAQVGIKYACNFRCMLPAIEENMPELNILDIVPAIVNALVERLGSVERSEDIITDRHGNTLACVGDSIDKVFDVNFLSSDTVCSRLLGGRESADTEQELVHSS